MPKVKRQFIFNAPETITRWSRGPGVSSKRLLISKGIFLITSLLECGVKRKTKLYFTVSYVNIYFNIPKAYLNKLENEDGNRIVELENELRALQLEEESLVQDLKIIREKQTKADADLQVIWWAFIFSKIWIIFYLFF